MIEFLFGFGCGIAIFIGYGAHRALNSDGWDNSNLFNWLRLLSHVYIHPEDFGSMYYLEDASKDALVDYGVTEGVHYYRPFYYISKDEFAENFKNSRP